MGTNFGGVHVGCHCWVPLQGHCWVPLLGHAGVPLLAGCHCWVPLLIAGVPLLDASYQLRRGCHCWGAIAGCHCAVPLLDASGVHDCWVPWWGAIARKIDQSVTPFSAAPFSTLITHKLACAIWGLCWYNLNKKNSQNPLEMGVLHASIIFMCQLCCVCFLFMILQLCCDSSWSTGPFHDDSRPWATWRRMPRSGFQRSMGLKPSSRSSVVWQLQWFCWTNPNWFVNWKGNCF